MFTTIQKLKHIVRTAFGDSESSFGGEFWREIAQLHGVGQGNGAGPAIWAVISSVIFDYIGDKGYGAKITAPLSKLAFQLAGCGFVDDTDLMQTGNIGDDYVTVSSKLQDAIDLWEIGARASGGEIVTDPTKSWYCLIDFEWNEGEWSYNSEMDDVDITVKNGDGMRCPLSSLAPSEARRMLGVYLAADGNNTTQVKEMRNTAEVWQDKVRVGHLNRSDA